MDLPAVDLERLEGDKREAGAVLLGVSEVEIQQDNPEVRVDCRDAGEDARMLNDFLRFDVLAAGASTTGSRGMDAILDAVSVRGKRGVGLDEAAARNPTDCCRNAIQQRAAYAPEWPSENYLCRRQVPRTGTRFSLSPASADQAWQLLPAWQCKLRHVR